MSEINACECDEGPQFVYSAVQAEWNVIRGENALITLQTVKIIYERDGGSSSGMLKMAINLMAATVAVQLLACKAFYFIKILS